MNAALGAAALCGLLLGLGAWSILATVPAFARPRLIDRVAPHLTDVSETARRHVGRRDFDPLPLLGAVTTPVVQMMRRLLTAVIGRDHDLERRLRRSGGRISLDRYRTQQAIAALAGLVAAIAVTIPLLAQEPGRMLLIIALPVLGLGAGAAARELLLRRAESRRMRRIASEYPTVLEFLTLSLSAGEGVHSALARVSRLGHSELGTELGAVVRRTQVGVTLAASLDTLERDLAYPPLERTCDHIVTALERGAPLVDVLRAQARDARDLAKRDLLEQGGRNEIRMMVPLVMLVLPITVLFAAYPSYFVLTTTF